MNCKPVLTFATLALLCTAHDVGAQLAFHPATNYPVGASPSGVALGRLDGDLAADIAVTVDAPDRVSILLNSGTGSFGAPIDVLLAGGSSPHSLVAVDVDNDGDTDLVVTRKNVNDIQVLANDNGTFTPGSISAVGGVEPRAIVAGDLDGNEFVDVVTSNRDSATVSVLLNAGGSFAPAVTYAVGTDPRGLALADLDGDLLLDIAVASSDDRRVDLLFNLGGGVFGSSSSLSVGGDLRPDGVVAADLDGDLDVDVAASTSGDALNLATVFLNQGAGSFGGPVSFPVGGTNPGGIVAADLDVDDDLDLATANQDSANLSALPNLGGGTFGVPVLETVGTTPEAVASRDLDGNGSADLVTVNRDSNSVSVLLNVNAATLFADGFESGDTDAWAGATP